MQNIYTSIFDTVFEVSNSFSQLSSNVHLSPESEISFGFPNATSSPSRLVPQQDTAKQKDFLLRIAMLNFQSIKTSGKQAQLRNIGSALQANIVIGNESWLNPTLKSEEVFPEGFNCFKMESLVGGGGGVFLLIFKQYHSSQPEELMVDNTSS